MKLLFALSADDAFVLDGTNTQFATTTTSTELSMRRTAADLKLTALIQNVLGVQPSSVTRTIVRKLRLVYLNWDCPSIGPL
mmetsp:Transcript_395/g.581  ORF Transcript_395/g.581 Transcript_395/m.581 type:complete len:81 (-) Transcript_395:45-287(-)